MVSSEFGAQSKLSLVLLVMALLALSSVALAGPEKVTGNPGGAMYRGVLRVTHFDISPPLRMIPPIPPPGPRELRDREERENDEGVAIPSGAPVVPDPVVQSMLGPNAMPATSVSFNGPTNSSGVAPPDTNGAVGPNHFVFMVNLSFQVLSKTGTSLYGPAANNTLWSGFGGPCQTENQGDPVVLYDAIADRFLLSQFTAAGPTYYNCVALSVTGDPTGSYYRWAIATGSASANFPDYPKWGVWSNAYYLSTREFYQNNSFSGVGAYAINRSQMLAGNASPTVISFLVPPGSAAYNIGDGLLPCDITGKIPPPPGSPGYFVGTMDNNYGYGAPQDALTFWKFHADFTTPASSTFTLTDTLPVASYNSVFPCSPASRNCVPQPGTTQKIDSLATRQRPLHRLGYRNTGTHESLVTNVTVDAGAGPSGEVLGVRWYEIRLSNTNPSIYQQGTYAPGITDGTYRWMGSVAMDGAGNIALGYSASSATVYPSIWYTGRLAGDPLGTLPQGEGSVVNGTGSQTSTSSRWGDYSSMTVDPADDCTFWYVSEWIPTTSTVGWVARTGAFKFPSCVAPTALAFAQQPSNAEVFASLAPSVTAQLKNPGGENVAASGVPVTVSLAAGTGPLSGTVTRSTDSTGLATFDILSLGSVGLKQLMATCGGLTVPTSDGFSISAFATPKALQLDVHQNGPSNGNLNGVLEPGEIVLVEPSWTNGGTVAYPTTGLASGLSGAGTLSLPNNAANYGTISAGASANPYAVSGNTYAVGVGVPATRPVTHWDITFNETLSFGATKTWTLHVGSSFSDIPTSYAFYKQIETIFHAGVTQGYAGGVYGPTIEATRAQMAMFIARAKLGSDAAVPATGTVGGNPYDCSSSGTSLFSDVSPTALYCRHVHYLAAQGITSGCAVGTYCPSNTVSRAAMAMFIARALAGGDGSVPLSYADAGSGRSYSCVPASPILHFSDVTTAAQYCRHAHYLWARVVIEGCTISTYCPTTMTTRGQMSKFLANAFGLTLYHP